MTNIKSKYTTKKGVVMAQINITVKDDVEAKFNELCDGVSRSAVFSQLVKEAYAKKLLAEGGIYHTAPTPKKPYSILG